VRAGRRGSSAFSTACDTWEGEGAGEGEGKGRGRGRRLSGEGRRLSGKVRGRKAAQPLSEGGSGRRHPPAATRAAATHLCRTGHAARGGGAHALQVLAAQPHAR